MSAKEAEFRVETLDALETSVEQLRTKHFFLHDRPSNVLGQQPSLLLHLFSRKNEASFYDPCPWMNFHILIHSSTSRGAQTVLHLRFGAVHKDFSGQHSLLDLSPQRGEV